MVTISESDPIPAFLLFKQRYKSGFSLDLVFLIIGYLFYTQIEDR